MRLRTALYIFLLATLCMGCGGRATMRQLERLEAQIDSMPELVRASLDSLSSASLRGEARALYAILRTQADYKCYEPLTSDSLIRYATDYYSRNRKSYRAAMAWYSLGCVYSNLKNDAAAVEAYLQAQSLFPDTTVRYYRLCYQNLGYHYINKNMPDEALAAYQSYHRLSGEDDRVYADIKLAQAYILKHMAEPANEILMHLLQYREKIDTLSLRNILFELGKIEHTFNKNYDKADGYFNELITLYDEEETDALHWFKGNIAEHREDTSRALQYYQMAMKSNSNVYLLYNSARNLLYLSIDSIAQPELYGYVKLFEQASDSISRIERRTEIDDIRTAHAMELHQRELSERHRRFMYCAALIVVCLLAAIIIGVLLVERRRKQHYLRLQRELQRNQAEIYKMYESIEEKRDKGLPNREQILALYRDNLSKSVDLFKSNRWADRLQHLSEQRSKDIPSFTIKERELLAEALERSFINVITNLRDEAAKQKSRLSTEDIHLCLFLSLGYSIGVIRECLAASSDDVVRKRRVRLAGKLPEDFLRLFFN